MSWGVGGRYICAVHLSRYVNLCGSYEVTQDSGYWMGLLCQGPRWEPDNVMVQMVEGGLSGGSAGLSWPAVFTP